MNSNNNYMPNPMIQSLASIGGNFLKPRDEEDMAFRRKWFFRVVAGLIIVGLTVYGIQYLLGSKKGNNNSENIIAATTEVPTVPTPTSAPSTVPTPTPPVVPSNSPVSPPVPSVKSNVRSSVRSSGSSSGSSVKSGTSSSNLVRSSRSPGSSSSK